MVSKKVGFWLKLIGFLAIIAITNVISYKFALYSQRASHTLDLMNLDQKIQESKQQDLRKDLNDNDYEFIPLQDDSVPPNEKIYFGAGLPDHLATGNKDKDLAIIYWHLNLKDNRSLLYHDTKKGFNYHGYSFLPQIKRIKKGLQ